MALWWEPREQTDLKASFSGISSETMCEIVFNLVRLNWQLLIQISGGFRGQLIPASTNNTNEMLIQEVANVI